MTINSKAKGARFEREVASILRDNGYEARRGCQFAGGQDSPDVVSDFPFHIEAKMVEKLNLANALEQARRDSGGSDYCVIHRKKNQEAMITMPLAQFLNHNTQKNGNTKSK